MAEEKLVQGNNELCEILEHIKQGHNFLLSGGAGSGKTYSLVQVLQHISGLYPNAQIACITYTNAAAIEIKNRANIKNLRVSTIHDFLWDMIAQFQKEAKITLLELINSPESPIKNPNSDTPYQNTFENGIQYKEYLRIDKGEISHDEVLVLANGMFKKYPRLCDLVIDKFQFIFVDEYQDTSPLVVEILLEFIQQRKKKNIIGFFGDAMQSIYETGIGDIDSYIKSGFVHKVEKKQNRRNPQTVIDVANTIRTDGLVQTPSEDSSAPNMENGMIKQGSVKFLYSTSFDLSKVKLSSWVSGWDLYMQGKGVRVIYQPALQTSFTIGGIESFKESAIRNHQKPETKVIYFTELIVDGKIAARTGFPLGAEIYYLQRLHYLDGKALILNHNYFLKSVAQGLTKEIAEKSIYDYLENTLGINIVTSRRIMTVEKMTEIDEKYLELGDYNCMAVVSSHTYNSDGIMFEYTQSRHRPDYFSFQDNATRRGN